MTIEFGSSFKFEGLPVPATVSLLLFETRGGAPIRALHVVS